MFPDRGVGDKMSKEVERVLSFSIWFVVGASALRLMLTCQSMPQQAGDTKEAHSDDSGQLWQIMVFVLR